MRAYKHIPYDEFFKMWFDDSVNLSYMAERFKTSVPTIQSYAKRHGLKRMEKLEIIEGGLPQKEGE